MYSLCYGQRLRSTRASIRKQTLSSKNAVFDSVEVSNNLKILPTAETPAETVANIRHFPGLWSLHNIQCLGVVLENYPYRQAATSKGRLVRTAGRSDKTEVEGSTLSQLQTSLAGVSLDAISAPLAQDGLGNFWKTEQARDLRSPLAQIHFQPIPEVRRYSSMKSLSCSRRPALPFTAWRKLNLG